MILECGDLERALRTPELMPDMRAHAERCSACREQLHLWSEISRVAPQLHEKWESPFLWQRIRANLEQPRSKPRWTRWALAAAAVAVVALAVVLIPPRSHELLTDGALRDVQQAETVYARSIEKLSALAAKDLDRSSSPLAAAYREKLQVLDSAIADLKTNVAANRYNTYLQMELASLYRQKQQTLQDWLQNANAKLN
jgi:anti-sigma factor RsiW